MGEVFSQSDLEEFQKIGISSEEVLRQIDIFQQGVPFTQLEGPCTAQDGIRVLSPEQVKNYSNQFESSMAAGRAMKFVPASGAASRMFRDLLAFYNSEAPVPEHPAVQEFFQKISSFPFYPELEAVLLAQGKNIQSLLEKNKFREVLRSLLEEPGLAYAKAPKGLIPFHNYGKFRRTAFEEQVVEAIQYVQNRQGACEIHFTLGLVLLEETAAFLGALADQYKKDNIHLKIEISLQKSSTYTLAVDLEDHPFRVDDEKIFFRPGGHGALLENLSELDGDIVFINNIDNVTIDAFQATRSLFKKALGGLLVEIQEQVFDRIQELRGGVPTELRIREMVKFAEENLGIKIPNSIFQKDSGEQVRYLMEILNRPIRVCGMVRNVGEPGGGPYWVRMDDGSFVCQIVEAVEIDREDPQQQKIFSSSTHFNPVDLVCGVRNFAGESFDLLKFRDERACFISQKSHEGRDLKALEWPGLWNGGMAYWNTLFVEVPLETFAPVKTVNDLLRKEHQVL